MNWKCRHVVFALILTLLFLGGCDTSVQNAETSVNLSKSKITVILDTDIGDDIDDTWALALLLQCPEFDVKMILTATGDTDFRAKVVAKILEQCDRTDIPIGIGKRTPDKLYKPFGSYTQHPYYQRSWVEDYRMSDYEGKVYPDGVGKMVDIIMQSEEPVTIIAIGPLPNLAEALKRQPLVAEKSKVVGMHGSVRRGYNNSTKVATEWNVATYITDAQEVFDSSWPMAITPLDTCGIIRLKEQKYQQILHSGNPVPQTIIDGYRHWLARPGHPQDKRWDINQSSTVLYDAATIYLAMSTDLFEMEELGITVDERGRTLIDEGAKKINCAMEWEDLSAFEDFLVARLTNE